LYLIIIEGIIITLINYVTYINDVTYLCDVIAPAYPIYVYSREQKVLSLTSNDKFNFILVSFVNGFVYVVTATSQILPINLQPMRTVN